MATLDSPAPGVAAEFGCSLAVRGDMLAVGSMHAGTSGASWLFRLDPVGWLAVAGITSPTAQANEFFGASVAVDAGLVACGAPLRTESLSYQGAAFLVDLSADCDGNLIPDRAELAAGAPDCNMNGIPDPCDIASGEPDDDANGVPDVCEQIPCPADISGNGLVNASDLSLLLGYWGSPTPSPGDINGDGDIDGMDLSFLLTGWGPCP